MKGSFVIFIFSGLLILLVMIHPAGAQVKDAGLWTNITIEKKIVKRLDLVVTEELRMNENITEAGAIFTDAGLEYRVYGRIKAGIFYRYTNRRRIDDSYSQFHRFYADLSYRPRIDRLEIGYRVRIQCQYADINRRDNGSVPDWYLRNKLQLGYNTKSRFDPYMSGEFWYGLGPEKQTIDNLRVTFGVEIRITKMHVIDLGYLIQREFNVNIPEEDYVLVVGYKVSF